MSREDRSETCYQHDYRTLNLTHCHGRTIAHGMKNPVTGESMSRKQYKAMRYASKQMRKAANRKAKKEKA